MQKWWDGQESQGSKLSNNTIYVYVTVPQLIHFYNNFNYAILDPPVGPRAGQSWSRSITALQDNLSTEW